MSVAAEQVAERESLLTRARAARLEVKVVAGAVVLVCLHVLDDSFLQPEEGLSPADHLVSGLVPLAVLVGGGFAYPRLRAGRRAALALLLGVAGLVTGGVEPVFYGPKGALSGDDFTGILAAAAGAVLVAVALVTAWRGRRREGSLARRAGRRVLLAVAWVVAALFVVWPLSIAYGLTHVARVSTPHGDLGAPYESVSFEASDGLRLDGWFVRSRNGAAVIVYPGKKGTQRHARMLVRHGYGVLVFDRRGEGTSEGDPTTLGWGFDRDLLGAVAFLRGRSGVDPARIGGLGLSVGGEAMIQTAAETKALRAVVSEGAGSRSVREDLIRVDAGEIPAIAVAGVMTAAYSVFADRLPPPSLEELSGRIDSTPVFFIYAAHGQGGEDANPDYYRAARGPKQLWRIDTTHTHGLSARPDEYERRVVGFFDRALGR